MEPSPKWLPLNKIKNKLLTCIDCKTEVATKLQLDLHRTSGCKATLPFQCPKCHLWFRDRLKMDKHRRIHTSDKLYPCHKCHMSFSFKSNLNRHQKNSCGKTVFRCHRCNRNFGKEYTMLRHQAVFCKDLQKKKRTISIKPKPIAMMKKLSTILNNPSTIVNKPNTIVNKLSTMKNELDTTVNNPIKLEKGSNAVIKKPITMVKKSITKVNRTDEMMIKSDVTEIDSSGYDLKIASSVEDFYESDYSTPKKKRRKKVRTFKCEPCMKKFKNQSELNKHIRINDCPRPYQCNLCIQSFSWKSNLMRHQRTLHLKDLRFQCDKCLLKFSKEYQLVKHLKGHSKNSKITLTKTNRVGTENTRQVQVTDFEQKVDCLMKSIADAREEMEKDMALTLEKDLTLPVLVPNDADYLAQTIKSEMHSSNELIPPIIDSFDNANMLIKKELYSCSKCDRVFTQRSSQVQHERSHENKIKISCIYCPQMFYRKTALQKHLLTHTDGSLICKICNRIFDEEYQLLQHLEEHGSFKSFNCSVCLCKFSKKSDLVRHKLVHEKPSNFVAEKVDTQLMKKTEDFHSKGHLYNTRLSVKREEPVGPTLVSSDDTQIACDFDQITSNLPALDAPDFDSVSSNLQAQDIQMTADFDQVSSNLQAYHTQMISVCDFNSASLSVELPLPNERKKRQKCETSVIADETESKKNIIESFSHAAEVYNEMLPKIDEHILSMEINIEENNEKHSNNVSGKKEIEGKASDENETIQTMDHCTEKCTERVMDVDPPMPCLKEYGSVVKIVSDENEGTKFIEKRECSPFDENKSEMIKDSSDNVQSSEIMEQEPKSSAPSHALDLSGRNVENVNEQSVEENQFETPVIQGHSSLKSQNEDEIGNCKNMTDENNSNMPSSISESELQRNNISEDQIPKQNLLESAVQEERSLAILEKPLLNSIDSPNIPQPPLLNSTDSPNIPQPLLLNSFGSPNIPQPPFLNSFDSPNIPEPPLLNSVCSRNIPQQPISNSVSSPNIPQHPILNSISRPIIPQQPNLNIISRPNILQRLLLNSISSPNLPQPQFLNSISSNNIPRPPLLNSIGSPNILLQPLLNSSVIRLQNLSFDKNSPEANLKSLPNFDSLVKCCKRASFNTLLEHCKEPDQNVTEKVIESPMEMLNRNSDSVETLNVSQQEESIKITDIVRSTDDIEETNSSSINENADLPHEPEVSLKIEETVIDNPEVCDSEMKKLNCSSQNLVPTKYVPDSSEPFTESQDSDTVEFNKNTDYTRNSIEERGISKYLVSSSQPDCSRTKSRTMAVYGENDEFTNLKHEKETLKYFMNVKPIISRQENVSMMQFEQTSERVDSTKDNELNEDFVENEQPVCSRQESRTMDIYDIKSKFANLKRQNFKHFISSQQHHVLRREKENEIYEHGVSKQGRFDSLIDRQQPSCSWQYKEHNVRHFEPTRQNKIIQSLATNAGQRPDIKNRCMNVLVGEKGRQTSGVRHDTMPYQWASGASSHFVCSFCEKQFKRKEELIRHRFTEHEKNSFLRRQN